MVLLADAARVAFADVASPPAPSPAADAPFLPDVASPPTGQHLSVRFFKRGKKEKNVTFVTVQSKCGSFVHLFLRICDALDLGAPVMLCRLQQSLLKMQYYLSSHWG